MISQVGASLQNYQLPPQSCQLLTYRTFIVQASLKLYVDHNIFIVQATGINPLKLFLGVNVLTILQARYFQRTNVYNSKMVQFTKKTVSVIQKSFMRSAPETRSLYYKTFYGHNLWISVISQSLPANIRLSWKGMPRTNTLVYCRNS